MEFFRYIYPEYKKIFPEEERKPLYKIIKNSMDGVLHILKIVYDNKIIGFMSVNIIDEYGLIQLDYFAIFEKYRSNGYGKKAIVKLKEKYNKCKGIFVEIEKIGLGKDELENENRMRRAKFYENLNFNKLDIDIDLFNVIYTLYFFNINYEYEKERFIKDIFEIYYSITNKKIIDKKCKVCN